MPDNPYLKEGRLADVIAAITALGNYRYYKLSFEKCAEQISNKPDDAQRWGALFAEHPEFFRINPVDQKASLVWRRQHPKRYDPRRAIEVTREEYDALEPARRDRLSRRPLEPSEDCNQMQSSRLHAPWNVVCACARGNYALHEA
jgi:hypothetical protein